MKDATLKEVAQLANVSTATVSNVINNTKHVSEDLKKKVYESMKVLNYKPNEIAKSLKVKQSRLIGILISDISNSFISKVVKGIESTLSEKGYNVLLCSTDSDVEKEKEYLKVLMGKRIDGLIISSSGGGNHYDDLLKAKVPLVFLNRCPEHLPSNMVMTNNIKGAYMATEHLIKHGYKKIAIITGPMQYSTGRDRYIGYKRALEDYAISYHDELVLEGDFTIESGYELTKEIIESKMKIDAIFISNNSMSLGSYKYIKEQGLKIPQDIALYGFDDPEWADVVDPPLSGITQPAFELGVYAAQKMIDTIQGTCPEIREIKYLDPNMIIRKSCGC
ncbi:LacI family DNA-binding transcriptional regulator [Neobacillus sp. PS2-9]|uniref:LacI family DNA-binding transcriptional regulator n=1 Tax=Neobacillus sp. PS2-9 TaxID=3070676 RepID=UPI0027E195D8|nr:LacI family DNA-binding transcriptional regulator [Neobacillus sp. PS2-9]WML57832.1 LacI family DNA-binding transcriptional regulator [Neobacillus sp. PS2-9]